MMSMCNLAHKGMQTFWNRITNRVISKLMAASTSQKEWYYLAWLMRSHTYDIPSSSSNNIISAQRCSMSRCI